ncbi:MAG: hypothetical protein ACLFTR_00980, partial [Candidatus Woesearchaeota archaeon]
TYDGLERESRNRQQNGQHEVNDRQKKNNEEKVNLYDELTNFLNDEETQNDMKHAEVRQALSDYENFIFDKNSFNDESQAKKRLEDFKKRFESLKKNKNLHPDVWRKLNENLKAISKHLGDK